MSTVRCPNCRRALHLPEDREVKTACCPLCATEFEVPGGHAPPPLMPLPVPTQWVPPVPLPRTPRATPVPFPSDEEVQPPEVVAYRQSLAAASFWLKTASILGLTQLAMCGCCDFFSDDLGLAKRSNQRFGEVDALVVGLLLGARLCALFVIRSAADSLQRRQKLSYVRVAAILAVVLGLYMLWRSRVGLFPLFDVPTARVRGEDRSFLVLYAIFQAVVALPALIGGIWTLRLLGRSDVRSLYNS